MKKRGTTAIQVLILVVITVVLCTITIFVFLTNKPAEKLIKDARLVEEIYLKEEQIKFFVSKIAGDSLKEIGSWDENNFRSKMKEKVDGFTFEDESFRYMKNRIENNQYSVNFENNELKLEFKDFGIYMTKVVKESRIEWVAFIIPAGMREEIKDIVGAIYKTDLIIEVKEKV